MVFKINHLESELKDRGRYNRRGNHGITDGFPGISHADQPFRLQRRLLYSISRSPLRNYVKVI